VFQVFVMLQVLVAVAIMTSSAKSSGIIGASSYNQAVGSMPGVINSVVASNVHYTVGFIPTAVSSGGNVSASTAGLELSTNESGFANSVREVVVETGGDSMGGSATYPRGS